MKHFTKQVARGALLGMMSFTSITALADVVYTEKMLDNPPLQFLHKQFVSDGKSELYSVEGMGESEMKSYCKFSIYDGKFNELNSFTTPIYPAVGNRRQPYPVDICIMSVENPAPGSDYESVLTQTLFNDDDEFEWVIEKYAILANEYEPLVSGFKVMSQSGATIADVDFPIYLSWTRFTLYITSDGLYLTAYGNKADGDSDSYNLIYKIDSNSSSIQAVGEPRKMIVSPTAPRHGAPVNVSLGEIVSRNCKLSVVSASGHTVITQNLKPGDTSAVIDTNRLNSGVYVVVVDNGETKREATKIVVR